jgi:hypothetical protein
MIDIYTAILTYMTQLYVRVILTGTYLLKYALNLVTV